MSLLNDPDHEFRAHRRIQEDSPVRRRGRAPRTRENSPAARRRPAPQSRDDSPVAQRAPRARGVVARQLEQERRRHNQDLGSDGIQVHPVEENGEMQSRNVRLTVRGIIHIYEGGQIIDNKPMEEEEWVIVHFSNEDGLREGINTGLARLEEKVKALEEDSPKKVVYVTWKKAEDGYADDELRQYARRPNEIFMEAVTPIDMRGLKGAAVNRVTDINGFNCVVEYIYGKYRPNIPTLTRESILQLMMGTDPFQWEMDGNLALRGWRIADVDNFCMRYNISHYALDGFKRLVHKRVYPGRNYPMLAYYCEDGHMYPIECPKERRSIQSRFADRGNSESSTAVLNRTQTKAEDKKKEDAEKAQVKMFRDMPFYEDIPLEKLHKYKDCIVYYHKLHLKDMLLELFRLSGEQKTLYEYKHSRKLVTHIIYDNNVHLFANANHRATGCDWKTSMKVAEVLRIPYQNQSIATLAHDHFVKHYHPKGKAQKRLYIPRKLRLEIFREQEGKCNICSQKLAQGHWECDHIQPISNGGNATDRENLQLLCKKCHQEKSSKEMAEMLAAVDNSASYYNDRSMEVFASAESTNQFVHNFMPPEEYAEDVDEGRKILAGLDINKSRTNIWLHGNQDEWNAFSVLNDPIPFVEALHGEFPRGFYFVESQGVKLPLKGNAWLCVPAVKHCLKHGIIQRSQIKYALLSSLGLPSDYFKPFVLSLQEQFKDQPQIWKLMINSMIGVFGIRKAQYTDFKIMQNKNAAASYIFEKQREGQTISVTEHKFNEQEELRGPDYYEVTFNTDKLKEESHYPIYMQVLQQEWCELHKIQLLLEKHGGKLVHVNTDNAIALFDNQEQVDAMWEEARRITWDEAGEVQKYKMASEVRQFDRMEKPCEQQFHYSKPHYRLHRDPGDDDFEHLAKILVRHNKSFQIDSMAGTGKTTLARAVMAELQATKQSYCDMTPTHKSAKVLSKTASTIHSALGSLKFGNGFHMFSKFQWLIIDEKSMVKESFFILLYKIKKACPGTKIILIGDWGQLPPPCDRVASFNYADSYCVWDLCDGNLMRLEKCRRSDRALFNLYANPEMVNPDRFPHLINELNITYRNSTRKHINAYFMRKFAARFHKRDVMHLEAHKSVQQSQDVILFPGLKCIAATTRQSLNFVNCDEFEVMEFDEEEVMLKYISMGEDDEEHGKVIIIPTCEFTHFMQPRYAITCHRMQGSSVDQNFTIWDWEVMDPKLKYVALSRSRKLKYISICSQNQLASLL